MPRSHRRQVASRKYADYSKENLAKALEDIRSRNLTLRDASRKYKISLGTLSRKSRGLHTRKYGRPTVLSVNEEDKIVEGLDVAAKWGFPLTTRDLQSVIHSYLERTGRTEPRFKQNRPGRDWVYNFREKHPELTNRLCENIKRNRSEVSAAVINEYFNNLELSLEGVSPEGIINYDESNLCDDPGKTRVLVRRGMKHPERCIDSSKSSTSIMIACTASDSLLAPYVIYKAEHMYDSWTERGPPGTRYNRTKSGWLDSNTFEDWFATIIIPYVKKLQPGPKALIGDNLSSHLSQNVINQCKKYNIRFILLPANSTHLCQPLDGAFFRPLKAAWRKRLLKWKLANKGCIPKSQFPSLLNDTLDSMKENEENVIKSGFKAAGIFPIDREQVLKRLPDGNSLNIDETALTSSLKEQLNTMRFASQVEKEKKKKRIKLQPGKSVSGMNDSSDSDTVDEISLHDSDSSVGPESFNECDAEAEIDVPDGTPDSSTEKRSPLKEMQNKIEISQGDFLLVAFPLHDRKNKYRNYVGEVLRVIEQNSCYECKFLRPVRLSKTTFIYPEVDDICEIDNNQIVERLGKPEGKPLEVTSTK